MTTAAPDFLILEDDPAVSRAIARLLAAYGNTRIARTCADGIAAVDAKRPVALIVDEHLPDGSGLEVLQRVMSAANPPSALVLTGSDDADVANRAFLLGARYARKPVRADVLSAFASDALEKQKAPRARRQAVLGEWQRLYNLTRSEAALLELAVEGATRADLGKATQTSLRTIDTHIANLLRKTGDASLSSAVARVLRS